MKLFIGGLPGDIDEIDLKEMFELYGDVRSAIVIKDKQTGKSKGFGFVEMPNDAEAKETIELLNGVKMLGKKIAVTQAEDNGRSNNNSGGGRPFNNRPPGRRY
ncbi:MAG: RNA-binding protein [Hydrotalea flava]|nr:RNA-binding protein [Hydrotalea flava]NIM37591.1 RNA-binding protein [Hydrotalea flava]NIN02751.1 RNA-binding protein [Hydrotalea flava]NIN14436.1 RNA-binding protein [Hydrotalea flava]NIO93517.1 RNA-binding protein [Hydrotalea flava]